MTIQWSPIARRAILRLEDGKELHCTESQLIPLGGDVAALLDRAKSTPSVRFQVPDTTNAKGLSPRNYGRYAR